VARSLGLGPARSQDICHEAPPKTTRMTYGQG
jgi:hypothetical protein